MRSLLCFAILGIVALAANGSAQESKTKPEKEDITKATYLVTGLHWGACATTLEGSLKRGKGVQSAKVDFKGKYATVEFDEKVSSAQEVARAMSDTPHMMGRNMQYGGILLLSVAGVKDEATGKKAKAALSKVEGVEKVTLYPRQEAVGIEFTGKGKVTSKQLIEALEAAGLKAGPYRTGRTPNGRSGQAMNGRNGSMPEHAGMQMDNGGMGGRGAVVHRMACPCGRCGCCR